MFDKELCIAEELDAYVEASQTGQPVERPPDLPVDEWRLADKLLRLSAIARPDVQFLANLENQIFGAARKSAETIVQKNNIRPNGQSQRSSERKSLFSQPRKIRLLWLPLAASIVVASLLIFIAALSLPQFR